MQVDVRVEQLLTIKRNTMRHADISNVAAWPHEKPRKVVLREQG